MEGGQIMVVCIVALVMLTSLLKASIHSKHNADKKRYKGKHNAAENTPPTDEMLVKMNDQLDRITARLTALETIVTDEDRELKREFQTLKTDISNTRKSLDTEPY